MTLKNVILTSSLSLCAVLVGASSSAGPYTGHPNVPSASIASEHGPGMLWVNPANQSFDPDPRWMVLTTVGADVPTDISAAFGAKNISLGARTIQRAAEKMDWSLDYSAGIPLPGRMSVGTTASWHLLKDDSNFVAWDVGYSWHLRPWLGLSAVARNIGNPDPRGLMLAQTSAGIAIRPFGDYFTLGADYIRTFEQDDIQIPIEPDRAITTIRVRPLEGLYLRGHVEFGVTSERVRIASAGAALELYFGGAGIGAALDPRSADQAQVWLGSDEPTESLIRSSRRVVGIQLDSVPDYVPSRALLIGASKPSWLDLLQALEDAQSDKGIRCVVLQLDGLQANMAQLQELREQITILQARGKRVLAYLDGTASNGAYYLASAADLVAMHPAGQINLTGMSSSTPHLRGLLDLVGVEPEFVKRAEYKSAPETFTRSDPSESAREQQSALLDDMFDTLVAAISDGRKTDQARVEGWIDRGPFTAGQALATDIVDSIRYPDELNEDIQQLVSGPVLIEDLTKRPSSHSPWAPQAQVAVIYVEGAILEGSGGGGLLGPQSTGSDSVVRHLERARRDPLIRAVVLRVDSPGGSAFASDEIWRATQLLRESGKPLVVSMGSVAASGGYYISAGADVIWAEPTTITGSIGVYSGKYSMATLFDTVGVHFSHQNRGRYSGMNDIDRPWTDDERQKMEQLVGATYDQFKSRVATGRTMSLESVEEAARGRVWSGTRAKALGLVDKLGGLQSAIKDAQKRANLRPSTQVEVINLTSPAISLGAVVPSLLNAQMKYPQLKLGPLQQTAEAVWTMSLHPETTLWMMDPSLPVVTP